MHYYAHIKKQDDIYLVTFPDFPNINTYGETKDMALEAASDALNGSIEADFTRGFTMPARKEYSGRQYHPIYLDARIAIALYLRELRSDVSQSEIAQALGMTYQAYQKLENPRTCNPTMKTLQRIADVYGKRIDCVFV